MTERIKRMIEHDHPFDFRYYDDAMVFKCKHGYDKKIPCDLCKDEEQRDREGN